MSFLLKNLGECKILTPNNYHYLQFLALSFSIYAIIQVLNH